MSTTVNESFVSSRRSSLASILSISSSTASSSRRGSVTSVTSLDLTADELAFQECIEVIDANVEEVITNKAREKKWWVDGNYKIIDENRLPLILIEGDPQDAVDSSGSTTIHATPGRITRGSSKQPDDSFGNPWPTIIIEVANSESLSRIMHKTTQFWLAPNRVEDVFVLKLWKWTLGRDQNGTPLRRFTCYKFCRRNGVVNVHGNYQPVQIVEFGTIDRHNQPYNGCTAPGMCIMNIFPGCIFCGCPRVPPYPINNVVIDFFPIQQAIFRAM
ncbi:unnamed protein product [Rhizophagus irregularis]|nr:unnamed protein product [Rhizophagus irregularis]